MLPSGTLRAALLAGLVILSVFPAGTVAGGGSQDAIDDRPFLSQEISGSFSQSTYRVTRGEDVEITFSHSGPATLTVGGDGSGYLLQVDVSGSGTSTVTIDTYASTSANPDSYVEGGDATLQYPEGGLEKSLVATSYTLNLTVEGVTQDLGLLVIEDRPTATMTAHVAPGDLDLSELDHGGLRSAMTQRDRVAKGDYAVLEINATGLQNAIDPDHLSGESGSEGIEIFFEDLEAQPNDAPRSFSPSDGDVETFWDEESASLLVVWDTADVELYGGTHAYNVSLRIDGAANELLESDSLESSTNVTVVKPRIDLRTDDGQLEVYPWERDVITLNGTTNFAPGSTFEFRAQAFEPRPFLKKSATTVDDEGRVTAAMDFGNEARGIEFPLWVLGHRNLGGWEVNLRESNATFDFENQTAEEGDVARFQNVSLSVGGFLVLERPNGTDLGVSTPIGEGTNSTVNVFLETPLPRSAYVTATAVMDWNQNGSYEPGVDRPYSRMVANGTGENATRVETNVSKTAVIFVPETGAPEPPAADTNTTATPANNSTSTTVTTPTNTTSTVTTLSVKTQEPLTPGTTASNAPLPLGIPVLAILTAAVLLRRRTG